MKISLEMEGKLIQDILVTVGIGHVNMQLKTVNRDSLSVVKTSKATAMDHELNRHSVS